MADKIVVPKLGMSVAPLTLVEWKAKEGDWVEKGNVVLAVQTDKVTYDVEAEVSGYLHILIEAENEVPIGSLAGLIVGTKEELALLQEETAKVKEGTGSECR